jgi:hypothetical protein
MDNAHGLGVLAGAGGLLALTPQLNGEGIHAGLPSLEVKESVYPYVFPIRNVARPPKDLAVRAGYYCIDTFTPLNHNAFPVAARAVDCAMTAAQRVLEGARVAYALVRPPGHHAERRSFGGFCYLNSAAVAANYLSGYGRVAMLDVDYHHGNGQQTIFYRRADVLTVSLHGHPSFAYPYFTSPASRTSVARTPGRGSTSTSRSPSSSTAPATATPWHGRSGAWSASRRSTWWCRSGSTPPRGIGRQLVAARAGLRGERSPGGRSGCRRWWCRRAATTTGCSG